MTAIRSSVVITGASRGLGEAMALGFAQQGARLTIAARSTSDLERVQKACLDAGAADVAAITTDITDETQVQNLVAGALERAGGIDVFIANAGTSYAMLTDKKYREIITYDTEITEELFRVNVIGTWLCMKHALPVMSEGASFIAIGSETGRALYPGAGMYAITKSSIDALVTLAARENAQRGVRVNCLSPGGMVDTQLFGPEGMPAWLKEQHPPLPADIIVPAALWLASPDSSAVTGAFVSGKDFDARGADAILAEHAARASQHGR